MPTENIWVRTFGNCWLKLSVILWVALFITYCCSAESEEVEWNREAFDSPPAYAETDAYGEHGVKAIVFDGEPYKGRPTKVYAYIGLPDRSKFTPPYPGVVCVHGGGGTAFAQWVRIWNSHGFAAIAIDTNGSVPKNVQENPDLFRHEFAGPPRFGFNQAEDSPHDQWPFHAVSAIIRANSLLRSLPEVDSLKVGITGISWGGYLTSFAVGVDSRFKFAVPVYGCGFLDEGPSWSKAIDEYGHDRWMRLWDPSTYLPNAKCPMLWINGTNDKHYYLPMFQQSYRLPTGRRSVSIRVRMDHGHGSGWDPPEIYEFAASMVDKGRPLVQVMNQVQQNEHASAKYVAPEDVHVESARLVYTEDHGDWYAREWKELEATVDTETSMVSARIPSKVSVYYFSIHDSRGLTVSSEHSEVPSQEDESAAPN